MKTEKQKLKETIDFLEENQCEYLNKVLQVFSIRYMSKTDLTNLTSLKNGNFDTAIPLDYVSRIEEILPGFESMFNVYDYSENSYGEMTNIAELFVIELIEQMTKKVKK